MTGLGVAGCGAAAAPAPHAETAGSIVHTWSDDVDAGGKPGATIASNATVRVSCAQHGFKVADGDTWWYRLSSSPWDGKFYASADAFYNNGHTSGPLKGTPFVDPHVPHC